MSEGEENTHGTGAGKGRSLSVESENEDCNKEPDRGA